MRNDEELKKLAKDYKFGRIFTDRDAPATMVLNCFPVLRFLGEPQLRRWRRRPPALIYEYMGERNPNSVNGYPVFFSCYFLNKREFARFLTLVAKVEAALESL